MKFTALLNSPLEQFIVNPIFVPYFFEHLGLSFTNQSILLVCILFFVVDFGKLVACLARGFQKWVVYATTTPPSGSSGGSNSNPSGGNSPNGAGSNPGNGGGGNPGGNDPVVVATAAIAVDLFQVEFHSIVVEPIDEAKRNLLSDFNAEATNKSPGGGNKKTP